MARTIEAWAFGLLASAIIAGLVVKWLEPSYDWGLGRARCNVCFRVPSTVVGPAFEKFKLTHHRKILPPDSSAPASGRFSL
jgi:hypothetical protein